MERNNQLSVVVTGASKGIGKAELKDTIKEKESYAPVL